jgi:DNA-binding transcriptional regulator YhcF (GntR family)
MSILWRSENALTASSIAEEGGVSINTVQAALRNLVKKEYIEVAQIVYSGTVLSRSYQAIMSFVDHLAKNDDSNKILDELENSINLSEHHG